MVSSISPLRGIAPASMLYKSIVLTDELRGRKKGAEAPGRNQYRLLDVLVNYEAAMHTLITPRPGLARAWNAP